MKKRNLLITKTIISIFFLVFLISPLGILNKHDLKDIIAFGLVFSLIIVYNFYYDYKLAKEWRYKYARN